MKRFAIACALGVLMVLPAGLRADDKDSKTSDKNVKEKKIIIKEKERPRVGLIQKVRYLMPPTWCEELKLSDDQRKQVREFDDKFREKRRSIAMDCAAALQTKIDEINKGDETAPALAIMNLVTGKMLEMRHMRMDYRKKMLAVLSEEQREKYFELLRERPRHRKVYRIKAETKDLDKGASE